MKLFEKEIVLKIFMYYTYIMLHNLLHNMLHKKNDLKLKMTLNMYFQKCIFEMTIQNTLGLVF